MNTSLTRHRSICALFLMLFSQSLCTSLNDVLIRNPNILLPTSVAPQKLLPKTSVPILPASTVATAVAQRVIPMHSVHPGLVQDMKMLIFNPHLLIISMVLNNINKSMVEVETGQVQAEAEEKVRIQAQNEEAARVQAEAEKRARLQAQEEEDRAENCVLNYWNQIGRLQYSDQLRRWISEDLRDKSFNTILNQNIHIEHNPPCIYVPSSELNPTCIYVPYDDNGERTRLCIYVPSHERTPPCIYVPTRKQKADLVMAFVPEIILGAAVGGGILTGPVTIAVGGGLAVLWVIKVGAPLIKGIKDKKEAKAKEKDKGLSDSQVPGLPTEIEDVLKETTPGQKTRGKSIQYVKPGSYEDALKDFEKLKPKNVQDLPGKEGKRGTLSDGSEVNVRVKSKDGRPTIEIRPVENSGDKRIKIRYGDKQCDNKF